LLAGTTGGGKSNILKVIITTILRTRLNIYFHLVDLKGGVEFNIFRRCGAVKSFCRDVASAENLLKMMVAEVDRRYDLFFEREACKDIKDYNAIPGVEILPYEIVVMDEFADLQDNQEALAAMEELSRKARACGIYLIASTQRPSVDVFKNAIRSNFTNVCGLKCKENAVSRVICGESGLEDLRGRGHGKFFHDGTVEEFQAPLLTSDECLKLIRHLYVDKTTQTAAANNTDLTTLEMFQ
jgi:S-DNA-T family DNA segregation ATPase FtsK/SpoIIIE